MVDDRLRIALAEANLSALQFKRRRVPGLVDQGGRQSWRRIGAEPRDPLPGDRIAPWVGVDQAVPEPSFASGHAVPIGAVALTGVARHAGCKKIAEPLPG